MAHINDSICLYSGIYKGGEDGHYPKGFHYYKHGKSLYIPDKLMVTFFENTDGSGKQLGPFYPGDYHDLSFYGGLSPYSRMDVTATPYRGSDLISLVNFCDTGVGSMYPKLFRLPPGTYEAGGSTFPDNRIDQIGVPAGIYVKAFDKKGEGKGLELSGGTYNLGDFGFQDKLSYIEIESEAWECIGIFPESDMVNDGDAKTSCAATLVLNNPTTEAQTNELRQAVTKEKSYTAEWALDARITSTVGVSGGAFGVEVSAEVSVEFGASYGQSETLTESKTLEYQVSATAGPGKTVYADLMATEQPQKMKLVRIMKNTVTGEEIKEYGEMRCVDAQVARINYREV